MSCLDTDALLSRAVSGDSAASQQLFTNHRTRLTKMVQLHLDHRVRARVDPSDIVQETLLEAHGRLVDYAQERPLPFYPWLRQIAADRLAKAHREHLQTQLRSVAREAITGLVLGDESVVALAEQLVDHGTDPLRRMLHVEKRERVRQALAQLPSIDRELLIQRYLEGLPLRDIAAILHCSEAAAKMRHLRALDRLRQAICDLNDSTMGGTP